MPAASSFTQPFRFQQLGRRLLCFEMHASPPKVATPSRKVSRVHPAVSPRVSLVIPRHPAVPLNTPITSCSDLARSTSPTGDAVQDLAHDVVARSRQKDREAHLVKGRSTSFNGAAAERRCSGEVKEARRLSSGEANKEARRLSGEALPVRGPVLFTPLSPRLPVRGPDLTTTRSDGWLEPGPGWQTSSLLTSAFGAGLRSARLRQRARDISGKPMPRRPSFITLQPQFTFRQGAIRRARTNLHLSPHPSPNSSPDP